MDVYDCHHCSFRCSTWRKLIKHTFDCHSSLPGFQFVCCLSGCSRTFKTYSAISSHINRDHTSSERQVVTPRTSLSTSDPTDGHRGDDERAAAVTACGARALGDGSMLETSQPDCITDFVEQLNNSFIGSEQSEHDSMDVDIHADEEPSILQMQKAAARFLLTLKEQH